MSDVVFEFKCPRGHLTERNYPPRTEYSKHPSITCPECLARGEEVEAYIVFAYSESTEKNGRPKHG